MAKTGLSNELRARYLDRAKLFWKFVRDAKFGELQKLARKSSWSQLKWQWKTLGITANARTAAENLGLIPSEVFAHPDAIEQAPELFDYYRMLACLPAKGLSQIFSGVADRSMEAKCARLNSMIGELLETAYELPPDRILHTLYARAHG
jgi:hypothetical protein